MNDHGRVLFTAVGLSFVTKAVSLLLSFVTIPIAIAHLGAERFGLWVLALSSFSIMSNLDLGLVPATKNKMAEAFARIDRTGFQYLRDCTFYFAAAYLAIAVLAAGIGLLFDWSRLFNSSPSIPSEEVNALAFVLLLGVTSCSSVSFIEAVCAAQLELKLIRLVQLGSTLLGFALFAIALYMGGSLPWVAAGTHVACVLGGLFLLRRIIKARPLARNTTIKDVGRTVRQLLTSSLPFAGIQLTNAAFVALPSLIIAHTMTQIDVATFAVGYKFVTIPLFMVTEIGIVFWPLSTVAWTRGETTWLYTQLRKLILGTVALMLLFSLGSIFFGERIISLWTSGGVNVKTELLVSLAMWLTAQSVITLFSSFLRSVGDFKFELVVNLLSLGTFICIALLVVQKFGLTGIAFALFVSSLVTSLAPMALRVRAKLPQNSALRETKTQMQERDQA